jgi:hypothetical protein
VNFFHDGIPLRIVGQGSLRAQESLARLLGLLGDYSNLNFDLLPVRHAEVFVEFDGLAVDLTVNRPGPG